MENKHMISQYRERLDKTLASRDLTDEKTVKSLIKNQLLHSSQYETEVAIDNLLEKRTMEVSNFLDMLRSVSVNVNGMPKTHGTSHTEWKLKQETDDFRVMYREGLQGSPFHTLLVEGYVDGPVDACLCVSWETALYKKWWPQFSVPTFKITSCQCLQKIRIGEQISLVRVKVSWPLSAREALLHFYEFEYFQDDLIIVLINTISDLESIDRSTHGYSRDGISEAKDVVRIDLVGGFALQKVSQERSYFRTIANMDIKLEFLPPWLINFISRQLIGNGFRLYQKAVASVSKSEEDFSKALADPLYTEIHKELYSNDKVSGAMEPLDLTSERCAILEEHLSETKEVDTRDINQVVHRDEIMIASSPENALVIRRKAVGEIEESRPLEEDCEGINHSSSITKRKYLVDKSSMFCLSPEVEQALGTLEKVISVVRELGINAQTESPPGFSNEKYPIPKKSALKNSTRSEDGGSSSDSVVKVLKKEIVELPSDEPSRISDICISRHMGSGSDSREANHNKISPGPPGQDLPISSETNHVALSSSDNVTTLVPILENTANCNNKQEFHEINGIHENNSNETKKSSEQKKNRLCCLYFFSGR